MRTFVLIILIPMFLGCKNPDTTVEFEKIIFHTSKCFGYCSVYHLEIDNKKRLKLFGEEVYKDPYKFGAFAIDSANMGYFVGRVSDSAYTALTTELNKIGLDTLSFDGSDCCDGQVSTIIAYYNGKRKYLQSMTPPDNSKKLISILQDVCRNGKKQRTSNHFIIEGTNDIRKKQMDIRWKKDSLLIK